MSGSVSKIVAERNHRTLLELVLKPGNDVCADCKARAPRWASYNLGIFICVNCASIHRKIGTHVTKVKSITLDEWTKEQVEAMKENGNIRSNALYNPNESRHPPPANMTDSERDSELEIFIRSKYEYKRFKDRKSGSAPAAHVVRQSSPGPPPPPKTPQNLPPRLHLSAAIPSLSQTTQPLPRSASQPLPPLNADKLTNAPPLKQVAASRKPTGEVWDDLISLTGPSQSSSFPLQFTSSPIAPMAPFPSHPQVPMLQPVATPGGNGSNPFVNLSLGQAHPTTQLVSSTISTPTTPFIAPAPQSSPALHLGTTNPFTQVPFLSPSGANANTTAFSSSPNPFSSVPTSMNVSNTPTIPTMPLQMGGTMHAPSLLYSSPQTPMQNQGAALSFASSAFGAAPAPLNTTMMRGGVQGSMIPVGVPPDQMHLSTSGATMNPFPAMQMGQVGFSGATAGGVGTSLQGAFLNQSSFHPQQPFGGWVEQGTH